ncbi:MAG: Ribonuclease [bacterium]|nr:Ribonuclease [bacterium]
MPVTHPSSLTFFGALHHVTGSMHLGQHQGTTWTIDCGMIQGSREAEEQNYGAWPLAPEQITTAILTHAHLDHCGRLPRLVRDGFTGPIHTSVQTRELAAIVMRDAAKLSFEEAKYRLKMALRKGQDPLLDPFTAPLYDTADVNQTLKRFHTHRLGGRWAPVAQGIDVRLHDAGHILGSAHVELRLQLGNRPASILYSGDIGRYNVALMRDPAPPPEADIVVMESTYGDRYHPSGNVPEELAAVVNDTYERSGILVIPAFAISRTQAILWHLAELERQGRIPIQPVFLDSPMARQTTALYKKYPDVLDPAAHPGRGVMELPAQFSEVVTRKHSQQLNDRFRPCIIIAASGMMAGGRILHHFRMRAPVRENTILFTGFQAPGTLGRRVLDGAAEVKLLGSEVPVRAEVRSIKGFSAHADRAELLRWARHFRTPPRRCFLVHGEPEAVSSLQELLRTELGWSVDVPEFNVELPLKDLL